MTDPYHERAEIVRQINELRNLLTELEQRASELRNMIIRGWRRDLLDH